MHFENFVAHHRIVKRQRDRQPEEEVDAPSGILPTHPALERRQRSRDDDEDGDEDEDEEETSSTRGRRATSTRGRSTPTESTTSSEEETSTTSSEERNRRVTSTTSSSEERETSSTTSTTSSTESTTSTTESTTSTTSTSSTPTTTSTSSTPTTTSTTSSTRATTSSSLTSSSSASLSSHKALASDAASSSAKSSDDSSSTSSAGPIAGGIAAAVVVALAIGGFILWKRRRAQKNQDSAGYFPNNSNNSFDDDDDRSFVGGRGESVVGPAGATKFNEKYPSDAQAFNMQDMPAGHNAYDGAYGDSMMQQTAGVGAGPTAAAVGAYAGGAYPDQDPRWSQNFNHVRSSYDGQLYNGTPHPYAYPGSPPVAPIAEDQEPYAASAMPSVFAAQQQQQDGAFMPIPAIDAPNSGNNPEEGPFADPQYVNKLFKVARTFQPTMPDELPVNHGDRIKILVAYDDGWCLGENLDAARDGSANIRGVFPRDCVEEILPGGQEHQAEEDPYRALSPVSSDLNTPAPTLPPLDIGDRTSKTFDEASYHHLSSPALPESLTPTIEISDTADEHEDDEQQQQQQQRPFSMTDSQRHSTASTIQDDSVIDHFPEAPTGAHTDDSAPTATTTDEASAATPTAVSGPFSEANSTRPTSMSTLPELSQKRYTLQDEPVRRQSMVLKRSSSLFAGRDADLFLALDRALENHPLPTNPPVPTTPGNATTTTKADEPKENDEQ